MRLGSDTADDKIPTERILTPSQQQRERKQPSEFFFTGIYRWAWLLKAEEAGALLVALQLLRLAKMRRGDCFKFCATQTAAELKMSRSTLYRKLKKLEDIGLVRVGRRQRRWPQVQLLDSPHITR
jgi:DNA-binding transcriptional ArsR family regulator